MGVLTPAPWNNDAEGGLCERRTAAKVCAGARELGKPRTRHYLYLGVGPGKKEIEFARFEEGH